MPTAPTIAYSIVIGTQTSKGAVVVAAVVVGEGNLALRDVGLVTLIRTRPLVDLDPASDTTAAHMTLGVGLGPGVVDRVPRTDRWRLLTDVTSRGDQENENPRI
jgi:hypothetical protein